MKWKWVCRAMEFDIGQTIVLGVFHAAHVIVFFIGESPSSMSSYLVTDYAIDAH